jgi:hypothetical protein
MTWRSAEAVVTPLVCDVIIWDIKTVVDCFPNLARPVLVEKADEILYASRPEAINPQPIDCIQVRHNGSYPFTRPNKFIKPSAWRAVCPKHHSAEARKFKMVATVQINRFAHPPPSRSFFTILKGRKKFFSVVECLKVAPKHFVFLLSSGDSDGWPCNRNESL